jgi:hypothetical protein
MPANIMPWRSRPWAAPTISDAGRPIKWPAAWARASFGASFKKGRVARTACPAAAGSVAQGTPLFQLVNSIHRESLNTSPINYHVDLNPRLC